MVKKKQAAFVRGVAKNKKDFWTPWAKKEKTFTTQQVKELLDKIKEFNAGAIDAYLTKHVDDVFEAWAKQVGS